PAGHPVRADRDDHPVGDHPGRLVQDDPQARVQDGPAAAPLRAVRLGRDHDRRALLADVGAVRGDRPRPVLPGMDAQELMDRFDGRPVCVAGLGVSGRAAARVLAGHGARVTVVDARDGEEQRAHAAELEARGIAVRLGDGETLPEGTGLVVTSPGWRQDAPLLAGAAAAGIEIIGEVELAWRLRREGAAPWLAVTGTDGKTTVVRMLACMLTAAGHKALAVGNVGTPIVEAVCGSGEPGGSEPYDVLAVELSSYQLHWSGSLAPKAAAVLNIAPDHLDWHGTMV